MISDSTANALLVAIPLTITSLGTAITAIIVAIRTTSRVTTKVDTLAMHVEGTNGKIDELTTNVNGKMQELIDVSGRERQEIGHREGLAEGRELMSTERQTRVAETERVEDRARDINSTPKT